MFGEVLGGCLKLCQKGAAVLLKEVAEDVHRRIRENAEAKNHIPAYTDCGPLSFATGLFKDYGRKANLARSNVGREALPDFLKRLGVRCGPFSHSPDFRLIAKAPSRFAWSTSWRRSLALDTVGGTLRIFWCGSFFGSECVQHHAPYGSKPISP